MGDFIGYRGEGAPKYEDYYRSLDAEVLRAELSEHRMRWGKTWIVLPNPTYGSWERALYDFDDDLSAEQKNAKKLGRLKPWQR